MEEYGCINILIDSMISFSRPTTLEDDQDIRLNQNGRSELIQLKSYPKLETPSATHYQPRLWSLT